jgi:hypothetical protein
MFKFPIILCLNTNNRIYISIKLIIMFIMFNILIFTLLGLVGTAESVDFYPTVPECVVNYTTFFNSYADKNQVAIISNYSDISGQACGIQCNNNSQCTSFNFFPSDIFSLKSPSKCELISTKFNSSFLIEKNYVGYFLKSNNDCSSQNVHNWEIIIVLAALGLVMLCFSCYCCYRQNKKRNSYNEI